MRLLGYVRVSTFEQGQSGLGLEAQASAVKSYAASGGHEIVREYVEVASGRKDNRPVLKEVLDALARGEAQGLIVAKLDRLARSSVKIGRTMEQANKQGWKVIALDLGIDTSTPAGELVANVMAAVSQWEARAIGVRTQEALVAARARGVVLGRPCSVDAETAGQISVLRAAGMSFASIAARLNDDGVPASRDGRQWWPSTVRKVALRV